MTLHPDMSGRDCFGKILWVKYVVERSP